MVQQGRAQLLVDVSRWKPELRYRIIPEAETGNNQPVEEDTVEKLRKQDRWNREIAIEKAVEDVKRLVRENIILDMEFQQVEGELVYYVMLSSLRKENYGKLGLDAQAPLTDGEKAGIIASLTGEQKDIILRDFIVKHLSDTSGGRRQSYLLLEFALLHFPDRVKQIKEQYNEVYKKRHIRIEEKIRELQSYNSGNEEETATVTEEQPEELAPVPEPATSESEETFDPGIFDDPDVDNIPLYPGLPEHVEIGDIPEEDGDIPEAVYEEIAA